MRKRIIALLLTGGLMLGLWGCGSSSGSTAAPAPTPEEEVATPEALEPTEEFPQETMDEIPAEEADVEEYSEEEIIESGADEVEVALESEAPTIDVDTSALLTTHVVEYEDQDGYTVRETCQLSPIFREDDAETMYALWEALGNDMADFPSEESLYDASWVLRNMRDSYSYDKLEYVIGTYMVENLTEGFPITPDKARNFDRHLIVEHIPTLDDEQDDDAAAIFRDSLVSMVMYQNGATYYGDPGPVTVGKPKMVSDVWGPNVFVIALPNGATPNRPNGYCYDKVKIKLNLHYADEFSLKYFREGGD